MTDSVDLTELEFDLPCVRQEWGACVGDGIARWAVASVAALDHHFLACQGCIDTILTEVVLERIA